MLFERERLVRLQWKASQPCFFGMRYGLGGLVCGIFGKPLKFYFSRVKLSSGLGPSDSRNRFSYVRYLDIYRHSDKWNWFYAYISNFVWTLYCKVGRQICLGKPICSQRVLLTEWSWEFLAMFFCCNGLVPFANQVKGRWIYWLRT